MKTKKERVGVVMIAAAMFAIAGTLHASKTDDRIESSARESYIFKTYLAGDDIKIQSKEGAVTLTGMVSEESHKSLARETVAGLPGTKSVDNKLEVKGSLPTENSDLWLKDKVKLTLLFHRNVSATESQVSVQDGMVTLRGEAQNLAQKDLTTEYVKDIEGVKDVSNEMTVLKNSKTTYEKVSGNMDDASITAQVKMTLLFHRSTSLHNTKVKTFNGMVTLHGKAKNAAEMALVTKLVNDINGVKSVRNRMTVE